MCTFINNGKAIKVLRFLNIPFIITPKVVFELYKRQNISHKKAHDSLIRLSTIGRYSPEIISDALFALSEKKDG
jgi:hypothetical protein